MDFAVFGVAGALVIKRVVDGLKKVGLPTKFAPVAAFVTAAVLLAANEAAEMYPIFLVWYERVWNVAFFALVASEVYDVQHSLRNSVKDLEVVEGCTAHIERCCPGA